MIVYKQEDNLSVQEFYNVLINSTLGERRPVDDIKRLELMLKNANLIITARKNGKLIAVARSLTDFVYCTYLSDLAVDKDYQKMGIGKELIKQTKLLTPQAMLILLSAPAAIAYYPKIGMTKHENSFYIRELAELI